MLKKLFLFLISFCLLSPVFAADPASWDLLDEDCVAIGDWNDEDTDTGVSEVSPAGQFRFDTNTGASGNAHAARQRDIGSYPATFTVELKVYHDAIGGRAAADRFDIACWQGDERIYVLFASDGLFFYDNDSGWTEVGTDLVKHGGSAEWQTWRFVVDTKTLGNATCNVYLKDSTYIDWTLVGENIPCSNEPAGEVDGLTDIRQIGYATNDMVSHLDYIKIATGLFDPTEVAARRIIFIQ